MSNNHTFDSNVDRLCDGSQFVFSHTNVDAIVFLSTSCLNFQDSFRWATGDDFPGATSAVL